MKTFTHERCKMVITLDEHGVVPQFCPGCDREINHLHEEEIKAFSGPTLMEWVDAGKSALDYPPVGFHPRPFTQADLIRLDEMSKAETALNKKTEAKK